MFGGNSNVVVSGQQFGDTKTATALNDEGIGLFEQGLYKEATATFQKAVDVDPAFGPAHNNLGLAHFEMGDLYSAAGSFDTASQMMPGRANPFGNLGLALEAGGKVEEAVAMYETAHSIEPTNPVYLGNLIRARMRIGDSDGSVRMQLKELLFIETRPEWREWIQDQLAFFMNPRIQAQSVSPEFNPNLTPGAMNGQPGGELPGTADLYSVPQTFETLPPAYLPPNRVPPALP
ncbi:tetratricopeptide repeat protein [bacterium]|nr:tetratricopeptide repeat protein [bacterium]